MEKIIKKFKTTDLGTERTITFPIFQDIKNMGIFDIEETISENNISSSLMSADKFTRKSNANVLAYSDVRFKHILNGVGTSRLNEFRTYNGTEEFYTGYINKQGIKYYPDSIFGYNWYDVYVGKTTNDGVDELTYGVGVNKTHFIGLEPNQEGIVYIDKLVNDVVLGTIFNTYAIGNDSNTESIKPIVKKSTLIGVSEITETKSDIFIDRGNINALEKIMRLNEINGVDKLERYQNGFYKIL